MLDLPDALRVNRGMRHVAVAVGRKERAAARRRLEALARELGFEDVEALEEARRRRMVKSRSRRLIGDRVENAEGPAELEQLAHRYGFGDAGELAAWLARGR
jgi:hypothetical protein